MIIENLKSAILSQVESEQQYSPVRGCAMQLLDIVGEDTAMAKIVLEDLAAGLRVKDCEGEIKAFVDKNHTGKSGYCPPEKAQEIIRGFFGLGNCVAKDEEVLRKGVIVDLSQFL